MKKELFSILQCPLCHSVLEEKEMFLRCVLCKRKYSFLNGVPDFRFSSPGLFARFRIEYFKLKEFFYAHSWKEIFAYIFHSQNSPHQIAMGASLGVFLSIIPSFVLGAILALFIAWRKKYHLPATYFGTLIVNPFNGAFVYFVDYKVGKFFLGGEQELFPLSFSSLPDIGFALYLGGFLVGLVSALLVYIAVYSSVHGYRRFRRKKE